MIGKAKEFILKRGFPESILNFEELPLLIFKSVKFEGTSVSCPENFRFKLKTQTSRLNISIQKFDVKNDTIKF